MTLDQRSDEVSHLRELVRTLSARLAEAQRMLSRVQWQVPTDSPGAECDTCPDCGGVDPAFIGGTGHSAECEIAKALAP